MKPNLAVNQTKPEYEAAEYEAIVVGSGTAGATVARELSRQNRKVLMLERGANTALRESFMGAALVANERAVGRGGQQKLSTMRAITTGGSTALYFALANPPPVEKFQRYGIDLSQALSEAQRELPIAQLPDELHGKQALHLRESALQLGHRWDKNHMLVDQSRCTQGYTYEAKWKARDFVQQAQHQGTTLVSRATVNKILIENKRAVGVEYRERNALGISQTRRAYGEKIVLAAGALASPTILSNSGLKHIGEDGFYCDPNFALMGSIPGLGGSDNFVGSMSSFFEPDLVVGDANLSRTFYRLLMLLDMRLTRVFSYENSIAIGVMLKDRRSGSVDAKGRYHKTLSSYDLAQLKKGEQSAMAILKHAGARNIFHSGYTAGNVGGILQFGKHINERFETEITNLHVCDGSIIPEDIRVHPTLTLVCLAKYLSSLLVRDL